MRQKWLQLHQVQTPKKQVEKKDTETCKTVLSVIICLEIGSFHQSCFHYYYYYSLCSETIQIKDQKEVTVYDCVMDIPTPCLPNREDQTAPGYIPLEANPSYSTSKAAAVIQSYEVPVATNPAYAYHPPAIPH